MENKFKNKKIYVLVNIILCGIIIFACTNDVPKSIIGGYFFGSIIGYLELVEIHLRDK